MSFKEWGNSQDEDEIGYIVYRWAIGLCIIAYLIIMVYRQYTNPPKELKIKKELHSVRDLYNTLNHLECKGYSLDSVKTKVDTIYLEIINDTPTLILK